MNRLLERYLRGEFEELPSLEFVIEVGVDLSSSDDLVTNIAPFVKIGDSAVDSNGSCFQIRLKYEIKETTTFEEKVKSIPEYKQAQKILQQIEPKPDTEDVEVKSVLFRKLLENLDNTEFKLNYYDSDDTLIENNRFKLSDLIEIKVINANKNISNTSLSQAFNRIVSFRYNKEKRDKGSSGVDTKIDDINKTMTNHISNGHTKSINNALGKIESNNRLEVKLSADLTFDKLMSNIIKYEYKEGQLHIPESQFGLGYSNLMTIIGELIDYIERYPQQECHSKINLICIEEPEAFMHCQMQELFIKHINEAISYLIADKEKKINSQLIITTHSSHILNSKIHSGNSFNNISYITVVDNLSNVVNLNDKNVMGKGSSDMPLDTNGSDDLKFLKKHIKYKVSELFFSDAVIFVEGITEETLLYYYIDQNEELNRYYISIFNINGAHGLVYHPLTKLLKVPTLIITDLDIKRTEKNEFTQINDLQNKTTTNNTINQYNRNRDDIENLTGYFNEDNLFVTFQREAIEGYFSTSFEEAFILTNYQNEILKDVLIKVKPKIYKEIAGTPPNKENLKLHSYKLQKKLSDSKSDFANELLYKMIVNEGSDNNPVMPKYINDGLNWLKKELQDRINGEIA